MSFCCTAISAASNAVNPPIHAMIGASDPSHEASHSGHVGTQVNEKHAAQHVNARRHHRRGVDQRADRASGLPSRRATRHAAGIARTCPSRRRKSASQQPCASVPRVAGFAVDRRCELRKVRAMPERGPDEMIPSRKPKSPMRFVRNAFLHASAADGFLIPKTNQQIARNARPIPRK